MIPKKKWYQFVVIPMAWCGKWILSHKEIVFIITFFRKVHRFAPWFYRNNVKENPYVDFLWFPFLAALILTVVDGRLFKARQLPLRRVTRFLPLVAPVSWRPVLPATFSVQAGVIDRIGMRYLCSLLVHSLGNEVPKFTSREWFIYTRKKSLWIHWRYSASDIKLCPFSDILPN